MKTTITGEYIKELLGKDFREDGRKLFEYRPISIIRGNLPQAEGSSEVNIGNTKVICGVKISAGTPMPDKPGEGNLITGAELLPLAAEEFDVGPPTPEAIELARVTDRGIRAAGVIDLPKLFINEEKVWDVFVDIYVLNYDGNLFDASTLAAMTALKSARMPKYEDEKVIREGNLGKLPTANMVTSSTFATISNKLALDPSGNEELFMDARITIATDESNVRAMQKGRSGGFTIKEVDQLIEASLDKGKTLRQLVNKALGE